jgi:hypothetical protein
LTLAEDIFVQALTQNEKAKDWRIEANIRL